MVVVIRDEKDILSFVEAIRDDENFGSPMLKTTEQLQNNLLATIREPWGILVGTYEQSILTGVFSFAVEEQEKYLQLLSALSKNGQAYDEVFDWLEGHYAGYEMDCAMNPKNFLLREKFVSLNAEFDVEQQKMRLEKLQKYEHSLQIVPCQEKYRDAYCQMHEKDCYWTAEKVLESPELFWVFLAVAGEEVVGYIDVAVNHEENEIYDIYVREEYRNKGYGKALLQEAVKACASEKMMLLAEVDNGQMLRICQTLGFTSVEGENSINAHIKL